MTRKPKIDIKTGNATYETKKCYREDDKWKVWENRKCCRVWKHYDIPEYSGFKETDTKTWRNVLFVLGLLNYRINDMNYVCMYKYNKSTKRKVLVPVSTQVEFAALLQLSLPSFRTIFKIIKEKNIIREATEYDSVAGKAVKRYVVNPLIAMNNCKLHCDTYMLFKDELDKVLPTAAQEGLINIYNELHHPELLFPVEEDKSGGIYTPNEDKNAMPKYVAEEPAEELQARVLRDLIYHEEVPYFFTIEGVPKLSNYREDTDMYFQPNAVSNEKQLKDKDIKTFNSWFVDIDSGKDENGHYLSDDEVSKRKACMREIIALLPLTTFINETRNGYQIYWSCYEVNNREEWQKVEDRLVEVISIADKAVKNTGRLLRVPGSIWVKSSKKASSGIEPFRCRCLEANYQQWPAADLLKAIETREKDISEACAAFKTEFAITESKIQKKNHSESRKHASASSYASNYDSARVNAIRKLSFETFPVFLAPIYVDDVLSYVKNEVDMAAFLNIGNASSFRDIFHEDCHPSGSIYANEAGKAQRYVCKSGPFADRSLSIIDVVCALSGCKPRTALNYIQRIYNIRRKDLKNIA